MRTIIPVVAAALVVGFAVVTHNRLVRLRNRFKNAFSQIDVQLKRRYDLIPNLVETAKAYMEHERETLEAVIDARNQASSAERRVAEDPTDAEAMKGLVGAEQLLSGSLGRLFALAESYPDLKANENMAQLSEELTSTENRVAFARQAFNDAVMRYNTAREVFPANLLAGAFGFGYAESFIIDDDAQREAPKVSFGA